MYLPDLIRKEGLRRGLSHRTIKTYRQCIRMFFVYYKKEPHYITKHDIKEYLDNLIEKGRCGNTINVNLNALRFLYNDILGKKLMVKIRFSKTPKHKPEFLDKDEVKQLFEAIENPKHKLAVMLMYSAGLRVSELVHLRVKDFEFQNNYGWVRAGKGNKDRLFIIAESLKAQLMDYIAQNNLNNESWLFEGNNYNHLSVASIQHIIKRAAKVAKIVCG